MSPAGFIPLRIDKISVGIIRPQFARILQRWPEVFEVTETSVQLVISTQDFQERSTTVAEIIQ